MDSQRDDDAEEGQTDDLGAAAEPIGCKELVDDDLRHGTAHSHARG